jgi:ectoine hydroxylase-related dioxygenase (phytanoyl-CoA dioxygenase family)
MSAMRVDRELASLRESGFVVLPELLSPSQLVAMRRALEPHLRQEYYGRNDFEGHLTERVYTLVDRGRVFEDLVEHPLVLALCDALLEPNYLLTASQAIQIHPGETAQAIHTDDSFYRVPRPRPAISVSTIWAIDEFTEENGGTQIIAGSHTWDDATIGQPLHSINFTTAPAGTAPSEAPPPQGLEERLKTVVMPAGSLIFFLGTLVHRGGANHSDRPRLALSNQYCEPWARPQENYTLAIPPERVGRMSPRVQELVGYSIHPPFMGHIGGLHPRRRLPQ